ncbi:WD40 repeat protein [Coemansia sp. RSA 552]|nr:WD40 repeat protein [Coemansia sp. RSA 552]
MYWRVNCTEHLALDLRECKDSNSSQQTAEAANGGGGGGSGQRRSRPRSITFSGSGPGLSRTPAGQPQLAVSSPRVVRWASSPDRSLLAGVSQWGIYLWNVKPFVLLSSLVYDPIEFGPLVDVVWEPPQSIRERSARDDQSRYGTLFALLRNGYIYEISVYRRNTPVLEFQFDIQHFYARGPGEADGIAGFGIMQRRTYRLPLASSGSVDDSQALCMAPGGPQLAVVGARRSVFRLAWSGALASTTPVSDIYPVPGAQIVQIECIHSDESRRIEVYVFSDGAVRILQFSLGSAGEECCGPQQLDNAHPDKVTVLAYSAISGMAAFGTAGGAVLLYAASRDGTFERVDRIRFDHGRRDEDARVTYISWSPDGLAMACGYSTGHIVVYSVLGYELNATRLGSRQWQAGASSPEPAFMSWAPGATRLYVFSSSASGDGAERIQQGDVLPFVRAAHSVAPGDGNSRRVCLYSDEKILVHMGEFDSSGGRSLELADAQRLALDSPVVAMSCHNSMLLAFCRDCTLHQYAIFDDGADFIQVSFRRTIDLSTTGMEPWRVRSLQWVPSALFDHRPTFLVHLGTVLGIVQPSASGEYAMSALSERVELAITSGVNFGNMHSTVWWLSGRQQLSACLISLEDFMDGNGLGALDREGTVMQIRPEFYPVAVSADKGMVVGLDQDWLLEEHSIIGLSKLPVRAKLYLPSILDHILSSSDQAEQDALMYAACFEHLDFFPHAMEILLHEVLDREMSTGGTAGPVVLPRVVRLLENFASFREIVVFCARKTEANFWPRLFSCLGGTEHFFRQCLAGNQLQTATQCLIILQTLEPPQTAEASILALLEKTVAVQNSSLCLEILRFLKLTAESDEAMRQLYNRLHQST